MRQISPERAVCIFGVGLYPQDELGIDTLQTAQSYDQRHSDDDLISIIKESFGGGGITEDRLLGLSAGFCNTEAKYAWRILCLRHSKDEAVALFHLKDVYLPANTDCIVLDDAVLEDLVVVGADFKGGWIDSNEHVQVHCFYFGWQFRRFEERIQIQAKYRDYLKCVHVTLRQYGSNVVARIDWAAYTTNDHELGYDFASDQSMADDDHSVPIATASDAGGYGVVRLKFCERASASCCESSDVGCHWRRWTPV